MDLKKFKQESTSRKLSESALYLLKHFSQKIDELRRELYNRTKEIPSKCLMLTTVGGAATEEFALPGAKPGMHCFATLCVEGASPVTIKTAKVELNKLVVEFSADPSTDHKLSIITFY